jgi:hypothetical protein
MVGIVKLALRRPYTFIVMPRETLRRRSAKKMRLAILCLRSARGPDLDRQVVNRGAASETMGLRVTCAPMSVKVGSAFTISERDSSIPARYFSARARVNVATNDEIRLIGENVDLRRLLAQAGIDAAEQKTAERLQRLLLEELHHRVKNMLATTMAIASETLRSAESLEHGRLAIEERLLALGRVHDLLLRTNWTSTSLAQL